MKTINITASQQAYYERVSALQKDGNNTLPSDKLPELLRLIKLYRAQEEAFFDKVKLGEFSKDEKHYMMKTRKLLDNLLIHFSL